MQDLKLLLDDHTLLSSSVIHVVALVRRLAEGRFEATALRAEIVRQADLLHEQLVDHFDFEETSAFPQLEELFPAHVGELQEFVSKHDGILQTFDALRTELSFNDALLDRNGLLGKALSFEREFEAHATAETTLFNGLAAKLPLSQESVKRAN